MNGLAVLLGVLVATMGVYKLKWTLVRQLQAGVRDETDLRALTLCWCDAYLRRFPVPERAERALCRYAHGSGLDAPDLDAQLSEYCADEFKRRCKNQYLASLDLGED